MVNSKLIEQLQLPTSDNNLWEALRFVLANDTDADTKFLAVEALSKMYLNYNSLVKNAGLGEEYIIHEKDSSRIAKQKCKKAYKCGVNYPPLTAVYDLLGHGDADSKEADNPSDSTSDELSEESNPYDSPDYALSGFGRGVFRKKPLFKKPLTLKYVDIESGLKKDDEDYELDEAETSTERVRKYYKRHPEKVRKYLRDTVKDRVARNRDRRKAVKKHGKKKMKNHDVHHPNGAQNGNWRLAKKDHGRDKKNESIESSYVETHITPFVNYAVQRLNLNVVPKVTCVQTLHGHSLGAYNPHTKEIVVAVQGRLLADILRTLAHELVHVKQDEMGKITNPVQDGATGSPVENSANAMAGILLRDYGKMTPRIFEQIPLTENYLSEGGAAGHLAHPFEDQDLTFEDMKQMIDRGLVGGLDAEAPVTEKLDGQNIAFTVRDGQIAFARNKGHVKNRGKNALDVAGIRQMFAGRGGIEKAFTGAAEDLQAAVSKLTPEQVQQMFGDGSKFMSLEVILPDSQNVIPYGKSVLVMHGTIEYDENGEEVGRSTTDGKQFADAVTAVGADKQKTYGIEGPRTIAFDEGQAERYKEKADTYKAVLDRTLGEFGLDDKSTLEDYRRKWWEERLIQISQQRGIEFSKKEFDGLISRWADGDKKFGVKDIEDTERKKWFREFEKNELQTAQKEMIRPIETTFLRVGADAMRRATNTLGANNPEAAERLRKDVLTAIKAIQDSDDVDKIAKLQRELQRLESIGMDKIVPSEGVVFMYNGKPYKFTGTFAPINQILGTFKFGMAPKEEPKETPQEPTEEPKVTVTQEPSVEPGQPQRTIAVFSGRFQPFHAGHYSIYQSLVQRFGKENVYIASSDVTDPIRSPFGFNDRKEIMTQMFDIPEEMIVQVKNPYAPVEILEKLPKNTTYVTAVSQKDAERLGKGKYFRNFEDVPEDERKGYLDGGYFIVAPELQLTVDGKNISGTQLRAVMGDPNITDRAKQEIFTKVYGKFNPDIFKKIVKKTTESEEARKLTDLHGKPDTKGKPKKKKPADQKAIKRAKSVLRQRIKNPKTGRKIFVATALTYDKKEPVRQEAERLVQKAMQQNEAYIMENKEVSDNLQVYINVREHTEDELKHEIEEYFKNEKTLESFPDLADSTYELTDMIKKAPTEVLDKDELIALENSDVGAIIEGKNKQAILKKMINNKKDVVGLLKDIKANKNISMPVVVKHVGGYYLLGGNTRLSVLASLGKTIPVKVLYRSAPLDAPVSVYPAKEKKTGKSGKKDSKALFNSILQMRITNPETGNEIKVDTAMDYKKDHPAHKAAMAVIRQRMRGLSNRAGIPKNRKK